MRYADNYCEIISNGSEYIVKGKELFTKREIEVRIPVFALYQYRQGALIQEAMPMLSIAEREFLITGMYETSFEEDE